jgi:hypothetical protein
MPGGNLEQRGLACAVLADDGVEPAALERQRNPGHRLHSSEALVDAIERHERGHRSRGTVAVVPAIGAG